MRVRKVRLRPIRKLAPLTYLRFVKNPQGYG